MKISASPPLNCRVKPLSNRLLASLPDDEIKRIQPALELVHMPKGMVVYEAGAKFHYAYFPLDSIISLEYVLSDGNSAEVSIVGNEGIVGISSFLGGSAMPSRAVVYSAGSAYRLPASFLVSEFNRHAKFLAAILHYTKSLIVQLSQMSVCNRYHDVDHQLCRFLLMTLDRLPCESINLTQEVIGNMLGVRRESVSNSFLKLRMAGALAQSRGRITVLDRSILERMSCECYLAIKKETDRLIPQVR